MKRFSKLSLLTLAIGLSPGLASAGNYVEIETLAGISGLRERQVHMLFAPARSTFAEYRYTFDRVERKFIRAVGRERYEDLLAGEPVRFERTRDGERVVTIVRLKPAA